MKLNIKPSSNVTACEYDEGKKVFTVTFKNGTSYEYYDVPKEIALGIERAESTGKYFIANIRNSFVSKKLEKQN